MARSEEERRRARGGLVLLVAVVVIFVGQLVALALGQAEIALACVVLIIAAWFVFRSWVRRDERRA